MAKKKLKFKVEIIKYEFEPGWGASKRIDDTKIFDDYEKAHFFIKDYNKNLGKEEKTPYIYWKAHGPYVIES